jgi:hypothetical protein
LNLAFAIHLYFLRNNLDNHSEDIPNWQHIDSNALEEKQNYQNQKKAEVLSK